MAKTVLVVEDDTDNRRIVAKVLSVEGYNVVEAAELVECVEPGRVGQVDVEDGDVGLDPGREIDPLGGGRGGVQGELRRLEHPPERVLDRGLVVDDQERGHAFPLAAQPRRDSGAGLTPLGACSGASP